MTARGAGTSIAGNAVGTGLVLDFSAHLRRVLSIDPDAATAVVEPGVVQEDLQHAAKPYGLRFGPDPSSSSRCTIGGMIGNNACGTRALGYGRTSDNVVSVGHHGRGRTVDDESMLADLRRVTTAGLGTIRTEMGRFSRQVSGYALENLLPENGFDVARMLVGSEGTLGVLTQATVRLVSDPAHRVLVVLGYPDIAQAGDAVVAVLTHGPTACEGIDSRIVDVLRERRGPRRFHRCPQARPGCSWRSRARTSATPWPGPKPWRPTAARWSPAWSPTPRRQRSCGGSGPTAPGCRVAVPRDCRRTPDGRTPRCRRNASAPICASSTP